PSGTHAGRTVIGSAGGGIWTSDNNGASWTARSDQAPSLAIGSLAVDPRNPNHLIAGMGEGDQSGDSYPGFGILSSSDGGTTWSVQDPSGVFDGRHIPAVAIDPANSSHMFAATDVGLYTTSDGGTTWAKPTDPSYGAVDGHMFSVVFDPTTPTTVYIGGGAATVAKSTDGGVHWAASHTGISGGAGSWPALAISASSPNVLYVSIGTSNPVVLYRSSNGGGSWSQVTAPDYTGDQYAYDGGSGGSGQGWYDNAVAIDPTNPAHVI